MTSAPVRFAIVGLGHISQVAVLPAFAHAKGSTELTALMSDDAVKRRVLGKQYGSLRHTPTKITNSVCRAARSMRSILHFPTVFTLSMP